MRRRGKEMLSVLLGRDGRARSPAKPGLSFGVSVFFQRGGRAPRNREALSPLRTKHQFLSASSAFVEYSPSDASYEIHSRQGHLWVCVTHVKASRVNLQEDLKPARNHILYMLS